MTSAEIQKILQKISLFDLQNLFALLLLLAIAIVLSLGLHSLIAEVWKRGIDREKKLEKYKSLINFVVPVLFLIFWFDQFSYKSPALGLVVLLIFAGSMGIVALDQVKNAYAYFLLCFKLRLKVGDQLKIDEKVFRIKKIGLNSVDFQTDSGVSFMTPWELRSKTFLRMGRGQAQDLSFHWSLTPQQEKHLRSNFEALRKSVGSLAYRKPSTPIQIEIEPGEISIHILLLSKEFQNDAKELLFKKLQKFLH